MSARHDGHEVDGNSGPRSPESLERPTASSPPGSAQSSATDNAIAELRRLMQRGKITNLTLSQPKQVPGAGDSKFEAECRFSVPHGDGVVEVAEKAQAVTPHEATLAAATAALTKFEVHLALIASEDLVSGLQSESEEDSRSNASVEFSPSPMASPFHTPAANRHKSFTDLYKTAPPVRKNSSVSSKPKGFSLLALFSPQRRVSIPPPVSTWTIPRGRAQTAASLGSAGLPPSGGSTGSPSAVQQAASSPAGSPLMSVFDPPEAAAAPAAQPPQSTTRVNPVDQELGDIPWSGSSQDLHSLVSRLRCNEATNTILSSLVDDIVRCLSTTGDKSVMIVHNVLKGGSFGKSTGIRGLMDIDLVVYIHNFLPQSMIDYFTEIRTRLTSFAVLKSHIRELEPLNRNGLHLLVSVPALDAEQIPIDILLVGQTLPHHFSTLSAKEAKIWFAYFSKAQKDFVTKYAADSRVTDVIVLAKHWRNRHCVRQMSRPLPSYLIEVLVIRAYRNAHLQEKHQWNREQLFHLFLQSLLTLDADDMKESWNAETSLAPPYLLDPVNPRNNLLDVIGMPDFPILRRIASDYLRNHF